MKTLQERFEAKWIPEPNSGCFLWEAATISGYGAMNLKGTVRYAHHIAWELQNGPIPYGLWVLHKCDQKACVNVDHLFLGTHQDNMDDRQAKRRQPRGEGNGRSKLTASQIVAIRADPRSSSIAIAKDYGVHPRYVRHLKAGKSWRHL